MRRNNFTEQEAERRLGQLRAGLQESLLNGFNTMIALMCFRSWCDAQPDSTEAGEMIVQQWRTGIAGPLLANAGGDLETLVVVEEAVQGAEKIIRNAFN